MKILLKSMGIAAIFLAIGGAFVTAFIASLAYMKANYGELGEGIILVGMIFSVITLMTYLELSTRKVDKLKKKRKHVSKTRSA